MTNCSRNDVVLLQIPFSDLTSTKKGIGRRTTSFLEHLIIDRIFRMVPSLAETLLG